MKPPLEQLPAAARVAVIRLRSLGDCVLTTPALAILKAARAGLRVGVVAEERFAAVFEGNPDVDDILPPNPARLAAWRPDLCLNLHGGTRSMLLTAASAARFRAGFAHFRGRALYNLPIPTAQEILGVDRKVHTAEHLASAMFYLGAPRAEIPPAKLYAAPPPRRAPYAVLHAAASAPDKAWPAANFLETAAWLRRTHGLDPVFIGGAEDDLSAFGRYPVLAGAPLAEVKSLLSGASLFIGNDSGPAHMAAAFRVPVVVFFGPSDPEVWAPWKTRAEVFVSRAGLDRIDAARVWAAIERLRVAA